jgi:hypothetical protein
VSAANSLVDVESGDLRTSVTALSNGNYVVRSPYWNSNRGAVTWGSGATGVRGPVSAANSLVGSDPNDVVGYAIISPSFVELPSGNYVIRSPYWNGNRGAVTWVNGATGITGPVSAANSLVGSTANDTVGDYGLTTLMSGNYVVRSPNWSGGSGAVTWCSGTAGVTGVISDANSLVGSHPHDGVGSNPTTVLPSGDYVLNMYSWNSFRGAVTWGSGTTGVRGVVSAANSLVGVDPNDSTGQSLSLLTNGNYVITSPGWNGQRGAVTWGSGTVGVTGVVSAANSLVGADPGDSVGGITALPNGNYVVSSLSWGGNRGAATWCNGTATVAGVVSEANSLVGSNPGDSVGAVTVLPSGNYVVVSAFWNANRGAVTWGSGTAGVTGVVSEANSLVGSHPNDYVSSVLVLPNGNYLVRSSFWDGNRGAVTWGSGTTGVTGVVSAANSLVGSDPGDYVGSIHTVLSNGNYVVGSPAWNTRRGEATWGSGATGVTGVVSAANSLVGTNPDDQVGYMIDTLSNGNYLVVSSLWDRGSGAVTWGDGTAGVNGPVSVANSLVGEPGDEAGFQGVIPLQNGNYVVPNSYWNSDRGAVTWGSGTTGVTGLVSAANSLVGVSPGDLRSTNVVALSNGNYVAVSPIWNEGRGAVTWGSGTVGVTGVISEANSLVGSEGSDLVGGGGGGVFPLDNGNYVVRSPAWGGNRGAMTWGNGATGVTGTISEANSVVGATPLDLFGSFIFPLSDSNSLMVSPRWNGNRGAITWVNGTTGQTFEGTGPITAQNSLVGRAANSGLDIVVIYPVHQAFLVRFTTEGGGRIAVGLTDPNQFTFARTQGQTVSLTPDFLTGTLDTGTAVVLQASNDITVNDPITVAAGGHGGALTLQAGRSILLNASISTDNGPLSLIANDTLANGVVDAQRDPGASFITMAGGTALDTGAGPLTVELRDGAGRTNTNSRAINLQAITAGSVSVINNGPDPGSDVRVGPVTTRGPQSYRSPHGVTVVAGDLDASASPITFTDSVVVQDAVRVGDDSTTVHFTGTGRQTLSAGAGASIGNLDHTGTGYFQLLSDLTVAGTLIQAAGTFDSHGQAVTVGGSAVVTGGTYLAGTAPQTFAGGLIIAGGAFTSSSTGPMTVSGSVTLAGGSFSGAGTTDDVLTVYLGTVAPATADAGGLAVAGAVAFDPLTTFSVRLDDTRASQLLAGGPIELGGSTLSLSFGADPPVGNSFTLLTSSDPEPIADTFAGLPEGTVFSQGGFVFQITYQGGDDGNSVVLTRVA